MKNISILNPYSIKYLWNYSDEGEQFINDLINNILKTNKIFKLQDYYNDTFNSVRSYSIFKTNGLIVLIDFVTNNRKITDDEAILLFLKNTTNKEIKAIIFNDDLIEDYQENNIYYQKDIIVNEIVINILNTMPEDVIKLYNHEKYLLDNYK